ncbi:integral membrane peroxisomal protein importer-2 family [Micromonas pusilla CCMP1545]|uniref:Peroxisomal membrane protein PEX16 n=1 Tax=Micromonas pusilla (strain CCMP1545) TaxID=564608 RepID=C1N9H8_MICPC|nr:integral membrane peroxisomal protein importer-2 family [Micromonas pusilla CCMP1545]EEH51361.1 integral membrane peroxisomal protein importer-2 family [Micromonas pusilla CCMP1545]|eukprot:XP_003064456.1 integral membrane peroxisomal protein importer-2 family [Micromonas pusilla CCMP1545]
MATLSEDAPGDGDGNGERDGISRERASPPTTKPQSTRGTTTISIVKRYRTFVRRNRALIAVVEQAAAGLTWLTPDGDDADVYAEAASSAVGVFATMNEHLVRDSDDEEEEDENDDAASNAPSASGGGFVERWRARAKALAEATPVALPLALSLISQVEVLSEMLAKRRTAARRIRRREGRRGDEEERPPFIIGDDVDRLERSVVAAEAVKAAMKTALFRRQRGKLLLDDGCAREQLGEEAEEDLERMEGARREMTARRRRGAIIGDERDAESAAAAAESDVPPPAAGPPPHPRAALEHRASIALRSLHDFNLHTIHEREAMEIARMTRPYHTPPPPPGTSVHDVYAREKAKITLKIAGEYLHIFRPLVYACARRKFGNKSWTPFALSATMDVCSFACHEAAGGARGEDFSEAERFEMARRRAFLLYYWLRSPMFDRATLPVMNAVGRALRPIPLVGGLYDRGVAIAEEVSDHFAYTY